MELATSCNTVTDATLVFGAKSSLTPLLSTVCATPEATRELGAAFGRLLEPGDFVCLTGDLGAGKTLFVKGVAKGLGCDPDEVQSPTFTLVREYPGRFLVHHLDLYRLQHPEEELPALGFEEYFEPEAGVTLVEWADRAEALLPPRRFAVHLDKDGDSRRVTISAHRVPPERVASLRERLAPAARGLGEGKRST